VYQSDVRQDSSHRTSYVATEGDLWIWNSKEICKLDAKTGLQVWCDTTLEIPPIAHLLVQDSLLIFSTLTHGILVLNASHGEALPIPTDLQNGGTFGPIAASSSRIFLLKDDPFTLLAWDPGKDKIAWKVDLTEYTNYFFANFHGPVYAQGHVYVSGAGLSKVLKFSAENGRIEDERDLSAKMESRFLVKDGVLYFVGEGKVRAMDMR
jgi:outer membrane protein assembly factor BamB